MSNEPVAWMCPTGLEYKQRATDFMYNDALYNTKLNWIPLYTHPIKELTDEEILQVMMNVYSDTVPPIRGIEFAKAILKKAQEK